MVQLLAGELVAAASLVEEMKAVADATGTHISPYAAVSCAVVQGRVDEASTLIDVAIDDGMERGEGFTLGATEWASAVMYNGASQHEAAVVAASNCSDHPADLSASTWALSELVEAAVRSGAPTVAAAALAATRSPDPRRRHRLGAGRRSGVSRALLSNGAAAEALYRQAIERFGATRVVLGLARAHLLYGEWLRCENRCADARHQLRLAHEIFGRIGAEAFADRARRELIATGERVPKRTAGTLDELTAQEIEIARMAHDGYTNSQIGARLFISGRTVEWHLTNVFTKLQIRSRRGLELALSDVMGATALA